MSDDRADLMARLDRLQNATLPYLATENEVRELGYGLTRRFLGQEGRNRA